MFRLLLAGVIASFLSLAAPPAMAQSGPDCISGKALGGWDLPTSPVDVGHARGVLVLADGTQRFLLGAELHPSTPPNGHHRGRIAGFLRSPDSDRPVAEVHGFYALRDDGTGVFRAVILRPPRTAGDEPERVGRIEGLFRDPTVHQDSPGRFRARWEICR